MSEDKAEALSPSTSVPRRFIRLVFDFFVGLAIGLAPFLGTKNVPGFRALISVMPYQYTNLLITLSAFLMGIIVVAIQFYSAERILRPLLNRLFGIALAAMIFGFFLFYHLRIEYTVDVERRRGKTVSVLVGASPLKSCFAVCRDPVHRRAECIKSLSFDPAAIESCWDGQEILRRGEILGFSYLILTGGVGVLIGFLMLQEKLLREEKQNEKMKKQETQKPSKTKPAAPKAPKKARTAQAVPRNPEPSPRDPGDPQRSDTSKPARPAAKPKKPKTGTPTPRPKKPKPPE